MFLVESAKFSRNRSNSQSVAAGGGSVIHGSGAPSTGGGKKGLLNTSLVFPGGMNYWLRPHGMEIPVIHF